MPRASKKETSTARDRKKPLPPNAGKGRPKGVPNKLTADVKAMILEALSNAGGAEYLTVQAALNPSAFLTLVGKVLPMTVAGDINEPLVIKVVRFAADDIEQQPAQPIIIDEQAGRLRIDDAPDKALSDAQRQALIANPGTWISQSYKA